MIVTSYGNNIGICFIFCSCKNWPIGEFPSKQNFRSTYYFLDKMENWWHWQKYWCFFSQELPKLEVGRIKNVFVTEVNYFRKKVLSSALLWNMADDTKYTIKTIYSSFIPQVSKIGDIVPCTEQPRASNTILLSPHYAIVQIWLSVVHITWPKWNMKFFFTISSMLDYLPSCF